MPDFFHEQQELIDGGVPFVTVTLVDAFGSVPTDVGAKMIVVAEGRHCGTVGGGKLETKAIAEAQTLLREGSRKTAFFEWHLNKDVGMTCGGSVKLYLEAFNAVGWRIAVFGAGHVAQALVRILLPLECRVTCFDPRAEWLDRLPDDPRLRKVQAVDMPSEVASLPDDAYVVLMTMGHTTDKPILIEILRRNGFPYVGVIGSKAKAVRLRQDVAEAGLPEACQTAFHCPIGLDIGGNHPQEIAISVAAELLVERDRNCGVIVKQGIDHDEQALR